MNKEERGILLAIRDGMVTLVEQTTSLLAQGRWATKEGAAETKERIQATAAELLEHATGAASAEGAANQLHFRKVAADDFSPIPDPIPQPAPPKPTPDNPSPVTPRLSEEEQEIGKTWHINSVLVALGIQIKSGGTVEVNWDMFAEAIGPQQARELNAILEEMYGD